MAAMDAGPLGDERFSPAAFTIFGGEEGVSVLQSRSLVIN